MGLSPIFCIFAIESGDNARAPLQNRNLNLEENSIMAKILVQNTEVNVVKVNDEDYICLTDMIKAKDGDFFVTDWLRNRNTLEYIGIWEKVYNPNFNYGEFAKYFP